jgi:hypothetical protein
MPSSKDDGPGRATPRKERRAKPSGRAKGKQPGASGTALRWREQDELDDHQDRYPEGTCDCGADLNAAMDLGVSDRYQQHEIPLVSVSVVQYDQHAVACGCGRVHTAIRPEGAGAGRVEYGPNLRAYAVYLLVVHFVLRAVVHPVPSPWPGLLRNPAIAAPWRSTSRSMAGVSLPVKVLRWLGW